MKKARVFALALILGQIGAQAAYAGVGLDQIIAEQQIKHDFAAPVRVTATPTNGQSLVFNSTSGTWVAGAAAAGPTTSNWSTVLTNGSGTLGQKPSITAGDYIIFGNSAGASVSGANTGRMIYDSGSQTFKVSMNGAAYVSISTGAATLQAAYTAGGAGGGAVATDATGGPLAITNPNGANQAGITVTQNNVGSPAISILGVSSTGIATPYAHNNGGELGLGGSGIAGSLQVLVSTGGARGVVLNATGQAVATNSDNGLIYVASCAGTPTSVPAAYVGAAPIVIDSTNNLLYFYAGGAWRSSATSTPVLSSVLVAGNTTGARDISVTNGQKISYAIGGAYTAIAPEVLGPTDQDMILAAASAGASSAGRNARLVGGPGGATAGYGGASYVQGGAGTGVSGGGGLAAALGGDASAQTNLLAGGVLLDTGQCTGNQGSQSFITFKVSPGAAGAAAGAALIPSVSVARFAGVQNQVSASNWDLFLINPAWADGGVTSSGTYRTLTISPTINDTAASRTGHYEALSVNVSETSSPTGTNYLAAFRSGTTGATDRVLLYPSGQADFLSNGVAAGTNKVFVHLNLPYASTGLPTSTGGYLDIGRPSDGVGTFFASTTGDSGAGYAYDGVWAIQGGTGGVANGSRMRLGSDGGFAFNANISNASLFGTTRPSADWFFSFDGLGLQIKSTGAIGASSTTDAAAAPDTYLSRSAAGVWSFDSSTIGNGSGSATGANLTATTKVTTGAFYPAVKTITSADSPYSVAAADYAILCDCTGGAITVTIPAASSNRKRQLVVKAIVVSGGNVTIARTGSDTFDGATSLTESVRYASYTLQAPDSGADWAIE